MLRNTISLAKKFDEFFDQIDNEQPFWLDALVENIEHGKQETLTNRMRAEISGLASLQGHRTRESRKVLLEMAEKNPLEKESLRREGEAAYHFAHITPERLDYLGTIIYNCYWVIYQSGIEEYPFVTSDNPVILEGEHTQDDHSKADMIWPVSPNILIYAMNKTTHQNFPTTFDIQEIVKVNGWQAQNCHRFVFSSINSFGYIEKFLEDHPTLKDPNRNRLSD